MKTLAILLLFIFSGLAFSQNSDWVKVNPNPQNDFYGIKFFDQNTGYVVGSNGIILKNTTGSSSWIVIPSGTTNNLYGLYFFDVNHGYVVGQGELIMYTSNGGNSWISFLVPNGMAFRSVSFLNSNTGFVAGDNGSLYKTTTGITGFTPINITSTNLHSVFALDSLRIFACGDSGKFLRSTDGGNNWTSQTIDYGNLTCVYFMNSLTGYLTAATSGFGSNTNAYGTTDGGSTWTMIPFFRIQSNWGCVRFNNANTGYIAGNSNLIMHTFNGGLNWQEQGVPQRTFLNDMSIVDSSAFVCGNNGFIYETNAWGYTKYLGGMKEDLSSISFINENTGIIISSYDYLRTTNAGANWNSEFYGGYAWEEGCAEIQTGMAFFPPLSVYRVIESVNCHGGYSFYDLENSSDGGVTWNSNKSFTQTNIGINGVCEVQGVTYITANTSPNGIFRNSGDGWVQVFSGNGYGFGQISFANQNTGVVISQYPNRATMRTTDGGANWNLSNTGYTKSLYDLDLMPSGIGYLCGDSSFFERTTNFGATWTLLTDNSNNEYTQMHFVDDNTGWLLGYVKNGYQYARALFYTPNGGANIMKLQSLGNFAPTGMSFINALTGYVCGDSGVVLKTTNGGLTFVNSTLSNVPDKFSLQQNYPNPFNPVTKIRFDIPENVRRQTSIVKLFIYDVLGREVATLVNQQMQPGSYSVDWDASAYASGVYFYKLVVGDAIGTYNTNNGGYNQTKKMVLIK